LRAEQGAHLVWEVGTQLVAVGPPVWLRFSASCRVDAQSLHVHSGPFRWIIPLIDNQAVRTSRSVLSSPALSLDRIQFCYGAARGF
jgi:Bacterial PH domain